MVIRELINLIGFKVKDSDIKDADKKFDKLKQNIKRIGVIAGVAAGAMAALSVATASHMEESMSKFKVVFQGVVDEAMKMRDELNKMYGMSRLEATEALSAFQDFLVPMGIGRKEALGLSAAFNKLGVDLGSFNDAPTAEVLEALKSGIAGMALPMRKYGVDISDTTLKAMAEARGIKLVNGVLDRQSRAMLILEKVQLDSADAMGDFIRTSDGYANSMKIMKARIEDFFTTVGAFFLPIMTKLVNKVREMIEQGEKWAEANKEKLIETFTKLGEVLFGIVNILAVLGKAMFWIISSPLGKVILAIAAAMVVWEVATYAVIIAQKVLMAAMVLGKFLQFIKIIFMIAKAKGIWTAAQWALNFALTANPIGVIIMGVAALIAVIIAITVIIVKFRKKIVEFFKLLWQGIMVFKNVISIFMPFLWLPLTIIKNWKKIIDFFKNFKENIKSIFSGISEWIIYLFTHPIEAIKQLWFNLVDFFKGLFTGFLQEAIDLYNNVVGFFTGDKGKKTQKDVVKEIVSTTNNNQKTQNINMDTNINLQGGTPGSQNSNRQIANAAGTLFNLQLKKVLIENGGL